MSHFFTNLPPCCHPASQTNNIPYSLALRVVRICTREEDREEGLQELQEMLLERSYGPELVAAAISRARAIPRGVALLPRPTHQPDRRPVHVITYDPRLPDIQQIHLKHWRSMKVQDPRMEEIFPKPPIVGYKRQKNIKDYLIRSKVPPIQSNKPNRQSGGMKKCGKPCPTCPFVKEGKSIKYKKTNWEIYGKVNCETKNVIYLIECNKESCKIRYIGETEKLKLKEIFNDHKNYIKNIIPTQSTGEHFNTIVEKEDKNYTVVCSLQIREGLKKTRFLSTFCG